MQNDDHLLDEQAARDQLGGIGKTLLYELLKRGELSSVKLGRRRLVVASSVQGYIERLKAESMAGALTRVN